MRCVSEAEANSFIADTRDRLPLYMVMEGGNYQVYLLCSLLCVSAFMKIASSIMQQRQVQLRQHGQNYQNACQGAKLKEATEQRAGGNRNMVNMKPKL